MYHDVNQHSRQAAEAIGAISSPDFKAVLTKYLTDPNRSVRETCEIALAKIEWDNSEEGRQHLASKESSDLTPYVALISRFNILFYVYECADYK